MSAVTILQPASAPRATHTARTSPTPALVTNLAAWKARHSRPLVLDYLRWAQAIEAATRANTEAAFTLGFIWPRIMLRAMTGV